ncbi:hypothetical protein [Paraclostridium bifermentans]|jgi:hypothetical protein|uniref:Uncharacterized protein n=2 Tax=Paraclostridium bifermentans TaxID=1490 RepID=A0AA44DKZ0_PARBF|nr:hypothetical protein [Paraclostridium bifermentans]EQK42091.1 hypothetical protein C672_1033 [[Clostridium] bifermentans ATCC 638] [Paraclostridium bifermentans ATCC 638 = DSM 14991]MBN8046520.1 hypothetical protein [Paraclostridium bifermentans]MBS5954611.1 hypothetical protein [Paraclostridium bifermentans]MBU5288221.1 hypothetical protein [Paraclostridium bifermentans]MDU3337812.1 hypothetical protein [Paraclostridium bifermentans]
MSNKKIKNKQPNTKLEFAEELNLPANSRPRKSGSVAQNTSRPISKHPKEK